MWHPSREGRPAKQKREGKRYSGEPGLSRSICSERLMQLVETGESEWREISWGEKPQVLCGDLGKEGGVYRERSM